VKTRNPNEQRYLERACRTWDWARAAGVSADELREALKEAPNANGTGTRRRPVVKVLADRRRASDAA
jgi:hypothetical protein